MAEHANFFDAFLQQTQLQEKFEAVMQHTSLLGWQVDFEHGLRTGEQTEFEFPHVVGALVVLLILTAFALASRTRTKDTAAAVIPSDRFSASTFMELIVESTYSAMDGMMGREAARFFLPLIGSCAFFILFSNAIGLIPGFVPPTNKISTTLMLSSIIFLTTHIFGIKKHGFVHYMKHFMGPIWWLAPLMFPIELISHIVRPISLAIRLAANMVGDHAVLSLFVGFGLASFLPFPVAVYMLGVLVVVVQTVVFCLLSTVYISMAIAEEEH